MVILGLNPRKVYERQNPNLAILMHSKGNRELLAQQATQFPTLHTWVEATVNGATALLLTHLEVPTQ